MKIYFSGSSQDGSIIEIDKIKQSLIDSGYNVVIPDDDNSKCLSWTEKLNQRLKILNECDVVFMLPDWRDSLLARIELTAAMKDKKEICYSPEDIKHLLTSLGD